MTRTSLLAAFVALLVTGVPVLTGAASAWGAETSSTKERKEEQKQRDKEHKQFNREIQYRRVVGPNVLPIGPFSISVFVNGQPYTSRH